MQDNSMNNNLAEIILPRSCPPSEARSAKEEALVKADTGKVPSEVRST